MLTFHLGPLPLGPVACHTQGVREAGAQDRIGGREQTERHWNPRSLLRKAARACPRRDQEWPYPRKEKMDVTL